MNIRRTALLLLIWMTCQHAIGALVVPVSHNGVLGILPPNTAKTSEAPVFASL